MNSNERSKIYRTRLFKEGRCINCCQPKDRLDRTRCKVCRQKHVIHTAGLIKRRIAKGLCGQCSKPRNKYKALCDDCQKINSEKARIRMRKSREKVKYVIETARL